jgi:membrane protein implicated in regulation of membrane protease activity
MISTTSERVELFAEPGVGEVVKMIAPNERGRIKFRASFWPARFYTDSQTNALPSELVTVIGRDGITLLVTPIPSTQFA